MDRRVEIEGKRATARDTEVTAEAGQNQMQK